MVKKARDKTEAYKQLEADRKILWDLLGKYEDDQYNIERKIRLSYEGVKTININKIVTYLKSLQVTKNAYLKVWSEYEKLDRRLDKIST